MPAAANPILLILTGGDTAERDGSRESARHLHDVLARSYQTVLAEFVCGEWTLIQSNLNAVPHSALAFGHMPPLLTDLVSGRTFKPDAALISIHGRPGETGELQAYLDMLGIAYNGPGLRGAALAADKCLCKSFLQTQIDIRTPRYVRARPETLSPTFLEAAGIGLPFVLKPNDLGSAIGVLSVHSPEAIKAAIAEASLHPGDLIAEAFVEGMEVTVGAARFRQRSIAFEIAEVNRPDDPSARPSVRRYTDRKHAKLVVPARLRTEIAAELHRLTAEIGNALDIWGVYRADFIWDGAEVNFLEVNTLPGTSEKSVLIEQARASGFPPDVMFRHMAEDVLAAARILDES